MPLQKFETILNQLEIAGDNKNNIKTQRSPIVSQLKQLDTEIDKNIIYLKHLISLKFGKQHHKAYYKEFGIECIRNNYRLPFDRQDRFKALEKIVNSLAHYQFDNINYGLDYWSSVKNQYQQLLNQNFHQTQTHIAQRR